MNAHGLLFQHHPTSTTPGTLRPVGDSTLNVLTFVDYDHFVNLTPQEYVAKKGRLAETLLDIVEQYIPTVRKHIAVSHIQTPVDIHKLLNNPKGNVYGGSLTPKNYSLTRVTSKTPFNNLHLVGATATCPGLMGCILGSLDLHRRLTHV